MILATGKKMETKFVLGNLGKVALLSDLKKHVEEH